MLHAIVSECESREKYVSVRERSEEEEKEIIREKLVTLQLLNMEGWLDSQEERLGVGGWRWIGELAQLWSRERRKDE